MTKPSPSDIRQEDVREALYDPDGFNGCYRQAIMALQYLASSPRPSGGQENFNSEHLLQIADEMKRSRGRAPLSAQTGEPDFDGWPIEALDEIERMRAAIERGEYTELPALGDSRRRAKTQQPDTAPSPLSTGEQQALVKALEEIEDLGANGETAARLGNIAHAALIFVRAKSTLLKTESKALSQPPATEQIRREVIEECAKVADNFAAYQQTVVDRAHAGGALLVTGRAAILKKAGSRQFAAEQIAHYIRALAATEQARSHEDTGQEIKP